MRVLDLDLDFFVCGIANHRGRDDSRLSDDEYPAWSLERTLRFLENQCGLADQLPGVALEYHAELFWWWRDVIKKGHLQAPFSVTHVDAHADLGAGDSGHVYIMTDLLFRAVEDRWNPEEGTGGLGDGNFLAFAGACRWLSNLTYVRNEPFGPPVDFIPSTRFGINDLLLYHMKEYDLDAGALQLKAVKELKPAKGGSGPTPEQLEPEIPFRYLHWEEYQAEAPFDVVCLTRSPNFTPPASDGLYEAIRDRFIDEHAWF